MLAVKNETTYVYMYLRGFTYTTDIYFFPKIISKTHLSIDGFLEIMFLIGNGNIFVSGKSVEKVLRFITIKLGMLFPTG